MKFLRRPAAIPFEVQHCKAHGHPWKPINPTDSDGYWRTKCVCGANTWGGNTARPRIKNRDPFRVLP